MNNLTINIRKAAYAVTFLVFIPAGLWTWAKFTEGFVDLPVVESPYVGWIFMGAGVALMAWAMYCLKRMGKGLPMNAFPPPRLVTKGPYKLFRHPIYWGFTFLLIGYFIMSQSSSGLWLVTPITILSMMALVWGYEALDLKKRFPEKSLKTILDIPDNLKNSAQVRERFASLLWVGATLLLSNYVIILWDGSKEPLFGKPWSISFLDFQHSSMLPALFVVIIPFILKRSDTLRDWVITSLLALGIATFIALLYPEVGGQHLPVEQAQTYSVPLFIIMLSLRSIFIQSNALGLILFPIVIILTLIQLVDSGSVELHIVSSAAIYLLTVNYFKIWTFLKNGSENIANSWREWVFGKVRIINHGFYVGFGCFFGILTAGILIGDAYAWAILIFTFIVVVFSALWAQIIEGSEKLKRPYGYYGALVGIIFASFALWALGFNVWILIGAISVVMPWVQGVGRLRCLVNGCCHGSRVQNPDMGIKYLHHRSRVCGISHLEGELLHPTPLYSLLWLFIVGFILLGLWQHDYSPGFIFGLYLILTGIGRFVEEAYRGEAQTPIIKGLRLYQWTAILSVLIGIGMTFINQDALSSTSEFGWQTMASATIGGLFTTFAMGVDFPQSNARFSRLV